MSKEVIFTCAAEEPLECRSVVITKITNYFAEHRIKIVIPVIPN